MLAKQVTAFEKIKNVQKHGIRCKPKQRALAGKMSYTMILTETPKPQGLQFSNSSEDMV